MVNARVVLVLLALLAPHAAQGAGDRADEIERIAQSIAHDYMSPYCPGLLLADCSSSAARALRADIAAQLRAGRSESAVREAIEQRFGEALRASPAPTGFGLLAWLIPVAFVAAGALALALWIVRLRASPRPSVAPVAHEVAVDPALRARFEAELQRS